ncbi:MAG: AMP-binding protein [Fimbriimonadaceae bacterium]|nr:AMP-binding protein [Alphaproteobacteria bacterium]
MKGAERPLPHIHPTVVHMLADAAKSAPDQEALVCGADRLTYAQYLRCVGGAAAALIALGAKGKRVALICGNSADMAIAMFAVHAAEAQAVPINPIYTARELRHILIDSEPVAVVFDAEIGGTIEPLLLELEIANSIMVGGKNGQRLTRWKDDKSVSMPSALPGPDDDANLQYTGGTTGLPKGVIIKHGPLSINISQREAMLATTPDDESVLCLMPLFHVFASAMCLHLSVYCRGKMVILPRYHPDLVCEALENEGITRLPAGPTVFIGLMAHDRFRRLDFSRLRCAYSGSAPLPAEALHRWRELTRTPVLEGYGQTESGPVLTYASESAEIRPGSVGQILPRTEIEIVDVETGTRILGIGEMGEIRARGPQIMAGYRNRPDETAATLRGGWLYTGDIGEFDKDGYLYIRDRKKDMVLVGGYNVYPREIDEVLYCHPAVLEAAALGIEDDYRGEVIRAYVVAKPGVKVTPEELHDYCALNLAKYKVPSAIEIVESLPKTSVGKIDKKKLGLIV